MNQLEFVQKLVADKKAFNEAEKIRFEKEYSDTLTACEKLSDRIKYLCELQHAYREAVDLNIIKPKGYVFRFNGGWEAIIEHGVIRLSNEDEYVDFSPNGPTAYPVRKEERLPFFRVFVDIFDYIEQGYFEHINALFENAGIKKEVM